MATLRGICAVATTVATWQVYFTVTGGDAWERTLAAWPVVKPLAGSLSLGLAVGATLWLSWEAWRLWSPHRRSERLKRYAPCLVRLRDRFAGGQMISRALLVDVATTLRQRFRVGTPEIPEGHTQGGPWQEFLTQAVPLARDGRWKELRRLGEQC